MLDISTHINCSYTTGRDHHGLSDEGKMDKKQGYKGLLR
jgi:hypothetical protein